MLGAPAGITNRAKRLGYKWNPYEGILTGGFWLEPVNANDKEEYVPHTTSPSPAGAGEGGQRPGEGSGASRSDDLVLNQFPTETAIYQFLGLPFIEPQNRELDYLLEHFGP